MRVPNVLTRALGRVSAKAAAHQVSRHAFTKILFDGLAPAEKDIARATGLPIRVVTRAFDILVAAGSAVRDGESIVGSRGVTVKHTPHALTVSGKTIYTWCAYDLIGISAAYRLHAVAKTPCGYCEEPIEVEIVSGEPVVDQNIVGWMPTRSRAPVLSTFCPYALLFCDDEHASSWLATHDGCPAGEKMGLGGLARSGRRDWAPQGA